MTKIISGIISCGKKTIADIKNELRKKYSRIIVHSIGKVQPSNSGYEDDTYFVYIITKIYTFDEVENHLERLNFRKMGYAIIDDCYYLEEKGRIDE